MSNTRPSENKLPTLTAVGSELSGDRRKREREREKALELEGLKEKRDFSFSLAGAPFPAAAAFTTNTLPKVEKGELIDGSMSVEAAEIYLHRMGNTSLVFFFF